MAHAHIINDLLDMARLRTGKLSIFRALVGWSMVVKLVCHAIEEDAPRKHITLEHKLSDYALVIEADLTRIEQMVWTLVGNALKYTGLGSSISLSLARWRPRRAGSARYGGTELCCVAAYIWLAAGDKEVYCDRSVYAPSAPRTDAPTALVLPTIHWGIELAAAVVVRFSKPRQRRPTYAEPA
ncbi:hypothetical protein BJN34_22560 [Cupriavidus necator]|uniref:Signal transduction histidine kinase n=1 Tax=Cupriavidus necator TaxID=106590 RepID=A0A1U9UVR6_CUPNE|nr:HAMP domain-containing histidine kinase [Cupriavidus necator]AQV96649.1 hypothetical protein BJN34_22560 [Cupriavidus necator]